MEMVIEGVSFVQARPPLPQPQDWPRILRSTQAGISGMLCRGSRNGNALEASSSSLSTLLERFPSPSPCRRQGGHRYRRRPSAAAALDDEVEVAVRKMKTASSNTFQHFQ